jgi:hypothetical protein
MRLRLALGAIICGLLAVVPSALGFDRGSGDPGKANTRLQALNSKLSRAIKRVHEELASSRFVTLKDVGRERRTVEDLEATKLRAANLFPAIFGRPYADTFTKLSCIDEELVASDEILRAMELDYFKTGFPSKPVTIYASRRYLVLLQNAKACTDALEREIGGSLPSAASADLWRSLAECDSWLRRRAGLRCFCARN